MTLNKLKKMYKQQRQTKLFFEKDARNWQIKSDRNKNKLLNTIQERNFYVINQIKKLKINSLIDIGCGTAVLAMAAALCWSGKVLASDIDEIATETSKANAHANGLGDRIKIITCAGFDHPDLNASAPYALMPSPYEYWLEKRAKQVETLIPSTHTEGINIRPSD